MASYDGFYGLNSKVWNYIYDEDFKTIRAKCLELGRTHEDSYFKLDLENYLEWRRPREICDRPKFIDGKPSRFDALQGSEGDCWLVVALELITQQHYVFQHVVPPDQSFDEDYVGAFHFRIWRLGYWFDVVIDDRLPYNTTTQSLQYAKSRSGDVFWAALLEKAYAKTDRWLNYEGLYLGIPMTSFQQLSGGIVQSIHIFDPLTKIKFNKLFHKISKKQVMMSATVLGDDDDEDRESFQPANLYVHHAYAITKTHEWADDDPDYPGLFIVRFLNPWGTDEWALEFSDKDYSTWKRIDKNLKKTLEFVVEDDGEFWMKIDHVEMWFEYMHVCYLNPVEYAQIYFGDKIHDKNWESIEFSGEWVKDISDGGDDLSTRHMNPQFLFTVERKEGKENDTYTSNVTHPVSNDSYPVVIEITSRHKLGRRLRANIAFYIYQLKYPISLPLTKRFFEKYEPIDKHPHFFSSAGRAYLKAMELQEGAYCIVPCTEKRSKKALAQFLVRVFSGCRLTKTKLPALDTKISKPLPMGEQSMHSLDDELKQLFEHVVQGKYELDWEGLREILYLAMNTDRRSNGVISSVMNYLKGFVEKYLNLWSCNDNETKGVSFTKEECRSMIGMLDDEHSGKLSFPEFKNLWNKLCFWKNVYERHREERERRLKVAQLRDALGSVGYNINQRTLHSLSYVYATNEGEVCLTDFILCGVTLETVLSSIEKDNFKDVNEMKFSLENWVKSTLNL